MQQFMMYIFSSFTPSRFKTCSRFHFNRALEHARTSMIKVEVRYDVKARNITSTVERIYPVLANADGSSNDPVPTIRLKTNTKPT